MPECFTSDEAETGCGVPVPSAHYRVPLNLPLMVSAGSWVSLGLQKGGAPILLPLPLFVVVLL